MVWAERLRRGVRAGRNAYKTYKVASSLARTIKNVGTNKRKRPSKDKKRKKSKKLSKVTRTGNHSWQTTVTWGKYRSKVPKALRQNHPTNIWVNQLTERLANTLAGQQAIGQNVAGASLFTLGAMQAFFGEGDDLSGATQKRFLKSGTLKIMGTSNANTNIKVTLYNVTLKADMKQALTSNPVNAWERGYSLEGSAGGQKLMGSTPYDSGFFGSLFTIWKTTNFFLSQGESFVHITNVHVNREISMGKVWDLAGQPAGVASPLGYGGFKGITQWVMISVQGFPAHETTVNSNITVPINAVDLVYLQKGTFVENVIEQKEFTPITILNTTPATALQVINEDTGAEVNTFAG